jgi:hypothetical protein
MATGFESEAGAACSEAALLSDVPAGAASVVWAVLPPQPESAVMQITKAVKNAAVLFIINILSVLSVSCRT